MGIGFTVIALTYLGVVVATDGLGSAAVPAIAFFVIGFTTIRFWLSRD